MTPISWRYEPENVVKYWYFVFNDSNGSKKHRM